MYYVHEWVGACIMCMYIYGDKLYLHVSPFEDRRKDGSKTKTGYFIQCTEQLKAKKN